MFSMLRMAMTLLICVLAIGFYLGWFTFSRSAVDPRSDKVNINVSVDQKKVRADIQSAEQTLSKRMQDIKSPPPASGDLSGANQQPTAPRLNFGPIQYQPVAPSGGAVNAPTGYPPQPPVQTPDYQYTAPLTLPPPGEGR